MRDCNIKIGNDGQVTVSQVTEYIEEHSATRLVITLNNELKTDSISYYTLCFKPGAALKNPPDIKITSDMINTEPNGTLTYPLPSELTCFGSLDIQVQGHVIDNSGIMSALIKSPVFRLSFEPSITGEEEFIIGEDDGFISLIHSALAQLNLTVEEVEELCDKLTEAYENGEFNGQDGKDGKDGEKGEKGEKGDTGDKGEPAKINGFNAVTIEGGKCCEIAQDGETLTLNIDGVPVYHTLPETADDGDVCLYSPANVLTVEDSGKKVKLDLQGITAANVEWFDIHFTVEDEETGYINIGSGATGESSRFVMLNNGKEAWDIELTDGVLDKERSSYYPDISTGESVLLTELPQYFTLPAFDNITTDITGLEKAVFYAPLKLMAYRDGWYELISVEGTSKNGGSAAEIEEINATLNTLIQTDEDRYNEMINNDQGLSDRIDELGNYVEFNTILAEAAIKYVAASAETSREIRAGIHYVFGEVETLTLTLGVNEILKRYRNEYSFTFISGETPTVLTLPSSVQWANELTVEANKRYEISIVDNIGLWCAIEVNV